MATDERWYFTKEQLANSPSRRCGIDADKELSYRQQAANFIQDMGQRLTVSQLCINTAIVYMHRFYVFHSLTQFHRNAIAAAALFLAAKVEEQPRKLEHVIKVAHMCLHRETPILDVKSEQYLDQAADLVFNENVLLQTLAFDVAIDHPHTHVVRCCHLVKASKDLAQTSYFMASNSLHLTTMCLQYKPTVVACFCIHLACKWSNWEIPTSNEGKDWFWYVDKSVTWEQLSTLTAEFLHIFDKCPSRLRRKIRSMSAGQSPNMPHPVNSPFESEPRKVQSPVNADGTTNFTSSRPFKAEETDGGKAKPSTSGSSGRATVGLDDYREKRERQEREKAAARASTSGMNAAPDRHHSHHHKMGAANSNMLNKHSNSSSSNARQNVHHNHHHNSRQDVKQQMMAQRHSTSGSGSSSQSRDPNRDRQRTSSGQHANSAYPTEDALNFHGGGESATVHPPEKLSNNVTHNNRAADPRHGKQQQMKDAKAYGKYPDSRQARKPDILEQRSEEVRKLIEKPLPPPKPRAEQIKEEYAAMMLKKSHQPPKYGHQPEKPLPNSNSAAMADSSKMLNVSQNAFTVDKSPNAPVPASQVSHKSQMMPMKNGGTSSATSSFSLGTLDDPKAEKRPRPHEQPEQQQQVKQHRSLFSPEKTITPPSQPQQQQRAKPKPKPAPEVNADMLAFSGPNAMPQSSSADQTQQQRSANSAAAAAAAAAAQQKQQLRTTVDQDQRMQILEQHSRKFISSFSDAATGNNRMPDTSKPMKDGRNSLPMLDASKQAPSDMTKPLDDQVIPSQRYKQQQQHHHGLSNGLDSGYSKQEYSTIDPSSFLVKAELPDQLLAHEEPLPKLDNFMYQSTMMKNDLLPSDLDLGASIKRDTFSPLKSAQSISALLQEPLPPMPSLLQPVSSYEQHQPPPVEVKVENALPSTVDMSELVAPIQCDVEVPAVKLEAPPPSSDDKDKKDSKEHRSKSEKKKKKEKHRHKDKDKSKEKHKHKHKEKDKEKHRRDKSSKEKDKTDEGNGQASSASSVGGVGGVGGGGGSLGSLGAVPIKITIPKDKLNLSTESIGSSTTSGISSASASNNGSSSSLKIKIPKERLKGPISPGQQQSQPQHQQQQLPATMQLPSSQGAPPLKLKIRKEALDAQQQQQQLQLQQLQQLQQLENRKRERSDEGSLPTAKKHQQQRPNERQNGRHSYPSNSTNKVRGTGGRGPPLPPSRYPPYQPYPPPPQLHHAYRQQRHSPPPPYMRHPHPPPPFYPNYQAPAVFAVGYNQAMYEPAAAAMYYQYQQQQQQQQQPQYAMYPPIMTVEGQIDTSVPPPMLGQTALDANFVGESVPAPPPPLPEGPPPSSLPPPPPPPPE